MNIKNIVSATESETEESERFHFLPTPSLTFRLRSSEKQIVGVRKRSGRINQSRCTFPRFVIGLVLPLLLASPTTQFSLNRNNGVVSGIRTLFSLDRKVLRFSVASVKPTLKSLLWAFLSLNSCYNSNHKLRIQLQGVSLPTPLFRAHLTPVYNAPPRAGTSQVLQEHFPYPSKESC